MSEIHACYRHIGILIISRKMLKLSYESICNIEEGWHKMTDYEFASLLSSKKIVDSFQFYNTCRFKLASAQISFDALQRLINGYLETESDFRDSFFDKLNTTGQASYVAHQDDVDFLGQLIPRGVVIDKLCFEILSILHSFFDTFAQWLNSALFADSALSPKKVSLNEVIKKLGSYPEYTGQFITDANNIITSADYNYIADINNTIKHRHQIYTTSRYNLFAGSGEVSLPQFHKDKKVYGPNEITQKISASLTFCQSIFRDSYNFVTSYYSLHSNKHVSNRISNPKSYMLFELDEETKKEKLVNSIHFIEIDPTSLSNEYEILLISDDKENEEIKIYNSTYQIIGLRDKNTREYIGILKPADSDLYTMDDGRLIEYRKYLTVTNDYEFELAREMCNQPFNYYPFLSDSERVTMSDSDQ